MGALAEGLIVAWGLIYRERPIRLFFAIQLKGIHMVGLALFLWLLQAVSASPVSAAAHLGGIAAGFLFAQFGGENAIKLAWAQLMQKLGRQRKPALYVVPKPPPKGNGKEWVN